MGKQFAKLKQILQDHPITPETDAFFLYHLKKALLLALKEQGQLGAMQCRAACDRLERQQRNAIRPSSVTGESV
ncbi:hypothetical protein ACTQ33_08590 [Candidatus Avoscillospira sp. LCP25S3_F1]|uniref:hypothetical protein n=1 Tax=Candidatus Avoscillospira sp. LCP25S3_F1 TaxID=3438825 RepID=UPI003F8EE769